MDILTEGKISNDVESSARKLGIRFKKITADIDTNKFTGVNQPGERVRMNQWMADVGGGTGLTKDNYMEAGEMMVKILKRKYKLVKLKKFARSVIAVFFKDKKNPRTEFRITYAKSAAGPFIGYDGVKGE